MQLIADDQTRTYFQNVKQAFLYVTDECELRCEQCLYKTLLTKGRKLDYGVAVSLLDWLRGLGAIKLSLLGGEPTRYRRVGDLVRHAKEIGFEYVRVDTNGQFQPALLLDSGLRCLDEISFSLDGHTAEIDEAVRGRGSFDKCVANIKHAVAAGFRVNVTSCVHRGNCGRDQSGVLLVEQMVRFVEKLGVSKINFHPLLKMGVPRDSWAGETDIPLEVWISIYRKLQNLVTEGKFRIPLRLPQRFANPVGFASEPARYGFCPVKLGERALIHPNGEIRVCALMIGTPYAVARWTVANDAVRVSWNSDRATNEITGRNFDMTSLTPCTNQVRDFGEFVPLCISFKPQQDEFLWNRLGMR